MLAPNSKRKRGASKSNPNIILSRDVTTEAIPALVERSSLVTDEVFRERVIDATQSPSHFNALTNSDAYNTGHPMQKQVTGHGTNRLTAAATSDLHTKNN